MNEMERMNEWSVTSEQSVREGCMECRRNGVKKRWRHFFICEDVRSDSGALPNR